MLALLDGPSQDRLEELADEPIPGSLVVISCPIPALAVAAGEALGRRILGAEAARADMRRDAPESDRWTVAEASELGRQLALTPYRRHVRIVERADAMEQRAYDRLLRAIEEPPAPMLLVLTTTDAGLLPATLLGRSTATLAVQPAPAREHVDALVTAGATIAAAKEAITIAGPQADLALPMALSAELRTAIRAATAPRIDPKAPIRDLLGRLGAAATAAHALEKAAGGPVEQVQPARYDQCSPAAKAQARDILRLFAAHRRTSLTGQLASLETKDLPGIEQAIAAVTRFQARLARNVTPTLALAALGAETAALASASRSSTTHR